MSGINGMFGNTKSSRSGTDIVVNVNTSDAIKGIEGLEDKIKNLQKLAATNTNSTRTKLSLFGDINKVSNNLKKSWNEFVSYTQSHGVNVYGNDGKFNYSSIRDFNQTSKRLMGNVFKNANMFEAITGNSSGISAISPQLMEFVQGLRELPNNLNNPNNLAGMQEIVNMLREIQTLANSGDTKIPDILSQLGIKELTTALQPVKAEIQDVMEFTRQEANDAAAATDERANRMEQAVEREIKAYKTLAEIRAEAESRRTDRRTFIDDDDYDGGYWQLDRSKDDIERYNQELERLFEERDRILSEARDDYERAVNYHNSGHDDESGRWMGFYQDDLKEYQEYADRIDYIQEHLNKARLDFTPGDNWGGNEIKVTIELLQELVQQIQQVAQAFGTIDDESGIGTLMSQIKDMRANVDSAFSPAKLESFSSALSGISGKLESISASIGQLGEGDKSQMSIRSRLKSIQERVGKSTLNVNVKEDNSLETEQMRKQEEVKWDSYLRRYTSFYKQVSDIAAKYANGQMGSQTYLMSQMTNSREILEQFSTADDLISQFGSASVNDPTKSAKERVQIIMEFFQYLRTAQEEVSSNGHADGFWNEIGQLLNRKNFPSTDMSYINSQIKEIYNISSTAGQRKPLQDQIGDFLSVMSGNGDQDVGQIDVLVQSLTQLQNVLAQGFGIADQEGSITFFERLAQSMEQVVEATGRIDNTLQLFTNTLSVPQDNIFNINENQITKVTSSLEGLRTILTDIQGILSNLDFPKIEVAEGVQKTVNQNSDATNAQIKSFRDESSAANADADALSKLADARRNAAEASTGNNHLKNDKPADIWRTTALDENGEMVVTGYRGKTEEGTFRADDEGKITSETQKIADGYTKAKEAAKQAAKEAREAAKQAERDRKAEEKASNQQDTVVEAQRNKDIKLYADEVEKGISDLSKKRAEYNQLVAESIKDVTRIPERDAAKTAMDKMVQDLDTKIKNAEKVTDMLGNRAFDNEKTSDWAKRAEEAQKITLAEQNAIDKANITKQESDDAAIAKRAELVQDLADAYVKLGKDRARVDQQDNEANRSVVRATKRKKADLIAQLGELTPEEETIVNQGRASGKTIRAQAQSKLNAPTGDYRNAITGYDTLIDKLNTYYQLLEKKNTGKSFTVGQAKQFAELSQQYDDAIKKQGIFTDESEKAQKTRQEFIQQSERAQAIEVSRMNDLLNSRMDSMPAQDSRTEAYKQAFGELSDMVAQFNANPPDWGNPESIEKWYESFVKINDQMKEMQTGAAYKPADQLDIDTLNRRMSDWVNNNTAAGAFADQVKQLQSTLQTGMSDEQLNAVAAGFEKIKTNAAEANATGKSFGQMLKGSFGNLARYLMSFASFYRIVDILKQSVNTVRELDTQLVEMAKVSDESMKTLQNYQLTTFDAADQVGTTAKQIQASTADWMRLGEDLQTAAQSARESTLLMNVSEFSNIDDATESLVAMSQAYQELNKIEIIDKLNNIGNNYSISTNQLAESLQKSAGTLKVAGDSIDEAIALTVAGNQVLQDPLTVGQSLKTISLRLNGTSVEDMQEAGEEIDGLISTTSKLRQTIMDLTKVKSNGYTGFDILDDQGNYKSTFEKLSGLAKVFKEIREEDKKMGTNRESALLETIAGKTRAATAASILDNFEVLQNVYKDSLQSEGSAQEELDKYLGSINGKVEQLQNRLQELASVTISSDWLKSLVDLGTSAVKIVTSLSKEFGGLNLIISGITALFAQSNGFGSSNRGVQLSVVA